MATTSESSPRARQNELAQARSRSLAFEPGRITARLSGDCAFDSKLLVVLTTGVIALASATGCQSDERPSASFAAPPGTSAPPMVAEQSTRGAGSAGDVARALKPALGAERLAFSSGVARYDAAYAKAKDAIAKDIVGGVFQAGESWAQVWTRDTSYSIDLGAGLLNPTAAKATLKTMVEKDHHDGNGGSTEVWVQDVAGDFGGWPNLSDSIVGAQGAWSLYLTTGDRELLAWSYAVTIHTLARAERDAYLPATGLFGGCSSFMESNSAYPTKYMGTKTLLAQTKALSTNLLYYRGYVVAAEMGRILGQDVSALVNKAAQLKNAINARLWMEDVGHYAYFEDENGALEKKMEGAGEAFSIVWGVADAAKTQRILQTTYVSAWGIPSLWPQYAAWRNYSVEESRYYHNGMVWPFVQGYWAWAAAAGGSIELFGAELDHLVNLSEKAATFQEFYHPEDGAPDGSRRQLWSASGYLSMVYHGLVGMTFDPAGIAFAPSVPATFGPMRLDGVPYRGMVLNVTITGAGNTIAEFRVDGVATAVPRISADVTGTHDVDIVLNPGAITAPAHP